MFFQDREQNLWLKTGLIVPAFVLMLLLTVPLAASNLSDASSLRKRCEKELTLLEVPIKNFGDETDMEKFKKAEKLIKLAKVKYIQSKYPDAIKKYNEYLVLQHNLYKSLAAKYAARTEKLNDTVAEDLVDHIDNKKVEEYIRLANRNLKDAKSEMVNKHYKNTVKMCRLAKNYALSAYKLVGRDVPDDYKRDLADNDNRIFK